MFVKLAVKSLLHRKYTVLLAVISITLSIFVMLGVDHIKVQAKKSFGHTVSGVDLIVGSRTSSINLLLYTVFRIGSPTSNISWAAFETINTHTKVNWTIPLSLGDSHQGYRVIGTNNDYFTYFNYGNNQKLNLNEGTQLQRVFDVVIGFDVARTLGYKLGDKLTLSHGLISTHFTQHKSNPFHIVGILNQTGTPVDQALHVSFQGLDSLHVKPLNTDHHAHKNEHGHKNENAHKHENEHDGDHDYNETENTLNNPLINPQYTPENITAFLVGLKSKLSIFSLQRLINDSRSEPLLAILPGVALSELWQAVSVLEGTLSLIGYLVFICALLGLSAMLLSNIKTRNQEINLLRIIGAKPFYLYGLITLEAVIITLLSKALAIALLYVCLLFSQDYLLNHYGLFISSDIFSLLNIQWLAIIFVCTLCAAIPSSLFTLRSCHR